MYLAKGQPERRNPSNQEPCYRILYRFILSSYEHIRTKQEPFLYVFVLSCLSLAKLRPVLSCPITKKGGSAQYRFGGFPKLRRRLTGHHDICESFSITAREKQDLDCVMFCFFFHWTVSVGAFWPKARPPFFTHAHFESPLSPEVTRFHPFSPRAITTKPGNTRSNRRPFRIPMFCALRRSFPLVSARFTRRAASGRG